MHPVQQLFARPAQLLRNWLLNAGHTVVAELGHATVQVCVQQLHGALQLGQQPLIVVAASVYNADKDPSLRALYTSADWVWAMDCADYLVLLQEVGIPAARLRVLPFLFGTHYVPRFTCAATAAYDVVLVGAKDARAEEVMAALASLRSHISVHCTGDALGEVDMAGLLAGVQVAVLPYSHDKPLALDLHRLAFLLLVPGVTFVVEDAPLSVYCKLILNACPNIVLVPFGQLATAALAALDRPRTDTDLSALHTFATRLLAWDGTVPWTNVLDV